MITSSQILTFKPVQPTVRHNEKEVSYIEYFPQGNTKQYIYCYWELKSNQPRATPFHYRVVADGCIDIFFDLYSLPDAYIMGLSNTFNAFPLSGMFHYLGIRFLPTAFSLLFNMDVSSLTNQVEQLDHINITLHKHLTERLLKNADRSGLASACFNNSLFIDGVINQFEAYFGQTASDTTRLIDSRLSLALEKMLQAHGSMGIKELDAHVSTRQLRRIFKFYIGDSPKAFSKIIRFQHFLRSRPTADMIGREKLFFDLGYYDQAHFIKDFKTMYGLTPNTALR